MKMFNLNDIQKKQLSDRGIPEEIFFKQIEKLRRGSEFVKLTRPALLHDGIKPVTNEEKKRLKSIFASKSEQYRIIKFVPASGAATRMFKSLLKIKDFIRENSLINARTISEQIKIGDSEDITEFTIFLKGLNSGKFAFSSEIESILQNQATTINDLVETGKYLKILELLLDEQGLNYGNTPKALIKFHNYRDLSVTPLEEQIMESSLYMKESNLIPALHFSISSEFNDRFTQFIKSTERRFSEAGIEFSYDISFQKKETDTVAVDKNGNPVFTEKGFLLFRPGGHGSLLCNLNDIDSDIIFIKNIDNVTTKERIEPSVEFKMIMGGMIIEIRERIFKYLALLPKLRKESETVNDIYCYSKDILNIDFEKDFLDNPFEEKRRILEKKLNRPIRVCGMVENRGEPGGGPFWIKKSNGEEALQIVETAQIDKKDESQMAILNRSKYFNPVDMVCSITNHRGEKFDLKDFSDEEKYFVSEKYYNGEKITVLEHPGLWNGSMDGWITVFIEVPVETFNPVKFINDLLKDNHQTTGETDFFDN